MTQLTQDNRFISISDFSLGKDTFLLTSFQGTEGISNLFEFTIEVISENLDIDPNKIVGKSATVTVKTDANRKFNGFVREFVLGEIKADNLREYKMVMVPWFWFLSQTNDHRIFQEKNTKEIVSQVFSDLGFADFEFRAEGGKKRES
jgi:type VI secretion system secreted protein VgrG